MKQGEKRAIKNPNEPNDEEAGAKTSSDEEEGEEEYHNHNQLSESEFEEMEELEEDLCLDDGNNQTDRAGDGADDQQLASSNYKTPRKKNGFRNLNDMMKAVKKQEEQDQ